MFENVEKKLKVYAGVNFICVIVAAVLLWAPLQDDLEGMNAIGVLLMLLAYGLILYALLAGCWFIQAFAEITESVKRTNEILQTAFAEPLAKEEERLRKMAEAEEAAKQAKQERQAEEQRIREEEQQAREAEETQRREAYWAEHPEERTALLAKRREAEAALKAMGSLAGGEREQLQKLIAAIDEELNKER